MVVGFLVAMGTPLLHDCHMGVTHVCCWCEVRLPPSLVKYMEQKQKVAFQAEMMRESPLSSDFQ